MAITEKLRLVFEADASGAVREIDKLASVSERQLNRAKTSTEKWSAGLVRGGAIAIGAGAVIGAALLKTAEEAGKADAAVAALETALKRNAATAGTAAEPYRKLASALQQKTQFDDESILSGETVLVQMGATRDQITRLTPLVLDYAQRTGKEVPAAARDFGKALNGTTVSLKKAGIFVDETAYKQDRFKAIMDAASKAVGGQAEAYGKTFPGQLAILKNSFNEVQEGIGRGVIPVLQTLITPVQNVTHAFEGMSPKVQAAIGSVGGIGSVALIAGGGLAAAAGKAIQLRESFNSLSTSAQGAYKSTAAVGGIAVGLFAAAQAIYQLSGSAERASKAWSEVQKIDSATGSVRKFDDAIKKIDEDKAFQNFAIGLTPASAAIYEKLTNVKHGAELAKDKFKELAETSPAAARAIVDAMNGIDKRYGDYAAILANATDAQVKNSSAMARARTALDMQKESLTGVSFRQQALKDSIDETTQALLDQRTAQFAAVDANFNAANAVDRVRAALKDAADVQQQVNTGQLNGANATDALDQANRKVLESIKASAVAQGEAAAANYQGSSAAEQLNLSNMAVLKSLNDSVAFMPAMRDAIITQLAGPMGQAAFASLIAGQSQDQAREKLNGLKATFPELGSVIDDYINNHLNQIPADKSTNVDANTDSATQKLEKLKRDLNDFAARQYVIAMGGNPVGNGRASGGWVAGGVTLVGERGPELVNLPRGSVVTPNDRIGNYMQSGSHVVNYSVTVNAGIGTDGAQVGAEIVRYIKEYERRNGKRWN